MKLLKSWRFAIKCMKLSYNLKTNLFATGFLCVMALVYEIFNVADGMGAYLLLLVAIYPAQLVNSVHGSQLVQSSPYRKTIMTSLPTVVTFCSSIVLYLVVIGIEGIRVCMTPESMEYSTRMILGCGVMVMFLDIYVGIVYKYFVLSAIMMGASMISFYYLAGIIGKGTALSQFFLKIPMPAAIAIGLCFALLGGPLQYGVSLLVYKKPISRRAIYGLMRQQA